MSHLRRALTPRGTLVLIGGEGGGRWFGGMGRLLRALMLSPFCANGPHLWLRMQQSYDLWHAEKRLRGEVEKIPAHGRE